MKRVLIITYYWPPSGGGGVQRWLMFAKYLREFGWEPVIYTPENGEYPAIDESLEQHIPENLEVIRRPIWEPYSIYRWFVGRKPEQKLTPVNVHAGGWKSKLSLWIRGNLFIPDPRKYWVKPSIRYLGKFLNENPTDLIVTTGPPQSMHLIGLGLKQRTGIRWVADFRDPWTGYYRFDDLLPTWFARKAHQRLERKVLTIADDVIVVSPTMREDFEEIAERPVKLITNGFESIDDIDVPLDKKFSISHIGTMPQTGAGLWQALADLADDIPGFRDNLVVRFVGNIQPRLLESIREHGLEANLEVIPYARHQDVAGYQRRSQVLLLSIDSGPFAKGILTGKLFEYIASCRPILCIGRPDGDAARLIQQTGAGVVVPEDGGDGLHDAILGYYQEFVSSGSIKGQSHGYEKYSRRELTRTLADTLDALSESHESA